MARGTVHRDRRAGTDVVFRPCRRQGLRRLHQFFADGFVGPKKEPGSAVHRPSGLAVGPDGALYVTVDQGWPGLAHHL